MAAPKHTSVWEDGGFVGLACDGINTGEMLDSQECDVQRCPRCGTQVRVVWDVRIEEVPEMTKGEEKCL